jgi:biopolymer transport protein ExbB
MKAKHIMLALIIMTTVLCLYAQEPVKPVHFSGITPGELISDSGTWGYMIILTFVIGLVLAVIRYIQLYVKEKIDAGKFYLKLKNYIKNDQLDEAAKISESFKNTTLGFIFWSGLMVFKDTRKSGKDGKELRDSVQNAFDEAVLQTVHKLDGGLFWFDVLAQTCTYLGLLGTIWGLLIAFKALGTAAQAQANQMLTQGIKVAIGTTAMGLIAAVPLTIIKGALLTRAQNVISEIDEFCVKMINTVNYSIKD